MLYWMFALVVIAVQPDLETGISLRHEGRLEEAIEAFEPVLATQPTDPATRLELGHTLTLAGRYGEALQAYEKLARSNDPRWRLESLRWTGLTHIYVGDIATSVSRLEQLAELARQSNDRATEVFSKWYRGHIHTELAQFGQANSAFLEALELAPDDLNVLHLAGLMAARQGDEGSLGYQIEDLQQAVRRSTDASLMRRVYHLQAEHALIQEQPKKALDRIERANDLMSHPLYRDATARAHMVLDDPSAAETSYREIVTATDERLDIPFYYVRALLGLARALDAQGKTEQATAFYEQYLSHWGEASYRLPGVTEAKVRLSELGSSR